MVDIVKEARYSNSLVSIHLSGNNLTSKGITNIFDALGIDLKKAGNKV